MVKLSLLRVMSGVCVLALAGCGGDSLSRSFGLTHAAPDEFTVTTRAPLSMPPDFSLRPPQPGQPRPQEQTTTQSAEATLAPQTMLAAPSGGDSPGQEALLHAAGPPAPADIRAKVAADAAGESDGFLTDKLIFWKPAPLPGVVVDAQKEADRLNQNAALGENPATGDTPVIRRKSRNFLDTLF